MWYNTKITAMLGIDYPILQGPFGGRLSTVELLAKVSNAGGLGGYGAYTLEAHEIYEVNKQIKAATNKPYNINLWVSDTDVPKDGLSDAHFEDTKQILKPYFDAVTIPFPQKPAPFKSRFEDQIQVLLDVRPKVFSFVFGIPSPDILEQCRKRGIKAIGSATTVDEALALEAAGVDIVAASGFESGGHRPSFLASAEESITGTFVLIQLIREKVKIPVIATGGIATAQGIAAALTLGADAAQIGTAFLACDESGALPIHKEMLFSDAAKYTTLTRAFTGRLGRGIRNTVSQEVAEKQLLPFPLQTTIMSPLRTAAIDQEKWDMMLFWSGQIAPILKHKKADILMQSLIEETTKILK